MDSWPAGSRGSTPEHHKTLTDYAAEFNQLGESRFRLLVCNDPVLLMVSEGADDTSLNFKTSFMARDAMESMEIEAKSSPVWLVAKRNGGAFQDRIGVGRTRNSDIWILSQRVSKYHAYFTRREDGTLELTDAGSRNGTFVRGRRLREREPVEVPFGSEVGFGPCRFLLHPPEMFFDLVSAEARFGRR